MEVIKKSPKALARAAAVLKRGGVVICPTDTVYGFLADASNKKAVQKIYTIKNRLKDKPLPVFVSGLAMAKEIALIDKKQAKILRKFWPGAYTFILKRKRSINSEASEFMLHGIDKESIALRIPKHVFLQKLLKKVNRPLVQTSVNISAQAPLNSPEQIIATFGKSKIVGLIVDGGVPAGEAGSVKNTKPSKIIDLTTEKLTRIR